MRSGSRATTAPNPALCGDRAGRAKTRSVLLTSALSLVLAGCPGAIDGGGGGGGGGGTSNPVDGNRDGTLTSPLGKTFGEPNGSFPQSIVAVFDSNGLARLEGTVASISDLDVFQLGPIAAGDHVVIDAAASGSSLDVAVSLFDAGGRLVNTNDDRGGSGANFLDSIIDFVARHDGDPYYLVVGGSPFADRNTTTGGYSVDVTITPGAAVPPPKRQILVLDFDGAFVDSPVLGQVTVDPFDAAVISAIYGEDTQLIKDTILATFEQNYAAFNVTILTSDDPAPPAGTEFSSIYFGGFNRDAFGIAENVDLYNADFCDDALIFVETFSPHIFFVDPTATEMGIAIGNVGSHEAGHLLGLNHVDDDLDLMDDQSAPDAFIDDQEFMESPLSTDIMPIGTQDGVLLLDEIVGPNPEESTRMVMGKRSGWDTSTGRPAAAKAGEAKFELRRKQGGPLLQKRGTR